MLRLLLGRWPLLQGVTMMAILACRSLYGAPPAVPANGVRLSTLCCIDWNEEQAEDVVNALLA